MKSTPLAASRPTSPALSRPAPAAVPRAASRAAAATGLARTASPEAPVRRRRKEARPQELLDAALALFVEKGFAAARADEVARRAGVSKGTLYLYYPSKAELFKAVVRHTLSHLIAEGQHKVEQFQGTSSELIATLLEGWWECVGCTPAAGIHKVMLAEARNFPELAQFYADEVSVPAERLFRSAVRRGIERGEFRALPLDATTHALMAPMIFLALQQHSFGACRVRGTGAPEPLALLHTHLEIILHGLEAPPGSAARAAATPARRSGCARASTDATSAAAAAMAARAATSHG